MATFRGEGSPQPTVVAALRRTLGVRQILQLSGRGDVLAICIFNGATARRSLRAVIEEQTGTHPSWNEIEKEDWNPAIKTWESIARAIGHEEGLHIKTEPTELES